VSKYPVRIAAQVRNFNPRDFMSASQARHLGRFCQLAIAASRLAVEDARPATHLLASSRAGLFLGSGAGPALEWWDEACRFFRTDFRRISPSFPVLASPHSAASHSASEFGLTGPIATVSSECPSGLDAITAAYRRIQSGEIDMALAGAVDAPICPMLFAALSYSGMLSAANDDPASASRPFDRDRSGFVLGEGGAMLVLEDEETARSRGAHVYGEIRGSGAGRDRPTYIGETDPSGEGFVRAAEAALSDAQVDVRDIKFVNAHAPGVRTTDLAEIRAMRTLFRASPRRLRMTSIKGAIGQPLAVGGVLQTASTLLAFEKRQLPPTVNCDNLDVECDLNVVRGGPVAWQPGPTLVTSHGFGGNTTSLVLDVA
jgi:3-oxoacyl-(acyl-carrier-protein) synthase